MRIRLMLIGRRSGLFHFIRSLTKFVLFGVWRVHFAAIISFSLILRAFARRNLLHYLRFEMNFSFEFQLQLPQYTRVYSICFLIFLQDFLNFSVLLYKPDQNPFFK